MLEKIKSKWRNPMGNFHIPWAWPKKKKANLKPIQTVHQIGNVTTQKK